ncbi:MAG: hypothetical protein IH984_15640 [Planctomycetes bacterium]|nr:hypothetical protein [Planctomycetota bacterium]
MSAQPSSLKGSFFKKVIIAFVVLVCITILLLIALTLELNDDWMEKLTAVSAMLTLCFGVFVSAGAVIRRKHIASLMWLSCVLAVVGTFFAFILIWGDHYYDAEETVGRFTITSFALSIALAHSGIFSIVSTHTRLLFFTKLATMVCVWLCGTVIIVMFWYEDLFWSMGGIFWTILYIASFSTLASIVGTIIVPIAMVSHANKEYIVNESISSRVKILLECPKCAKRQELSSGNVRCSDCKASIFIEIEEPRCECGYLLYQLQGNNCPECGRLVRESEKWEPTSVGIDLETAKPDVE